MTPRYEWDVLSSGNLTFASCTNLANSSYSASAYKIKPLPIKKASALSTSRFDEHTSHRKIRTGSGRASPDPLPLPPPPPLVPLMDDDEEDEEDDEEEEKEEKEATRLFSFSFFLL